MKYIDIHCHLDFDEYDLDREEVISRAKENDIGMIIVGTNYLTSQKAIRIAEENTNTWAIIGLHPTEIPCEQFNFDAYLELAKHPKVVGIGECGFDYFRDGYKNKRIQQDIFEKQIAIANEVKKPLMLHLRSGLNPEENAYRDALEVVKKHSKVHGDVHFFVGNLEEAKQFIDLGFRLSFTGVITFARDYDEVIKNIPLNMIMSETDAPFVSPKPYRGERNEPVHVMEVVSAIASIRGEEIDKVSQHLVDNAKKLFSI
jgi:TatD DNase family protein